MAIFNRYVSLAEGKTTFQVGWKRKSVGLQQLLAANTCGERNKHKSSMNTIFVVG
jgi:hypothetical protein